MTAEVNEKPVALITAASKGIGAACARTLASHGYRVALMARSGDVFALAESLNGIAIEGDVTDESAIAGFVETAHSEFGRIDAVVNNTGHPARGDLLSLTDEQWHAGVDLLLLNVVRTARLAVPKMLPNGGGAFVNVSTLGAVEPSLDFPVSSAVRAALSAFTKLFADRYAADNIRMNNVLPGFADSYDVDEETRAKVPMGRAASVDEVAAVVAFLLSDEASYVTGQNVRVDGGMSRSV